MVKGKVPRHKLAPTALPIRSDVHVWCSIKLVSKVGIGEHISDDRIRIAVPDLVRLLLPLRSSGGKVRWRGCDEALSRCAADGDVVNALVHLVVVLERRTTAVLLH